MKIKQNQREPVKMADEEISRRVHEAVPRGVHGHTAASGTVDILKRHIYDILQSTKVLGLSFE